MIRQLGVILLVSFVGSTHAMDRQKVLCAIDKCQQVLLVLGQELATAKGDDIARLQRERESVMGDLCAWQCQLDEYAEPSGHAAVLTHPHSTTMFAAARPDGQYPATDWLHMQRGGTKSPTDDLLARMGDGGAQLNGGATPPVRLVSSGSRMSRRVADEKVSAVAQNAIQERAAALLARKKELNQLLCACTSKIDSCAAGVAVKSDFTTRVDAIRTARDEFYDWKIDVLSGFADGQDELVQMIMVEDAGADKVLFDAARRLIGEVEAISSKDGE